MSQSLKSYRELTVWQVSMDLTASVYAFTRSLPADERFGLIAQLRRAAVSVPANIAEGQSRATRGEFIQFLGIAKGSLAELETLTLLCDRLELQTTPACEALLQQCERTHKLLHGLLRSLSTNP